MQVRVQCNPEGLKEELFRSLGVGVGAPRMSLLASSAAAHLLLLSGLVVLPLTVPAPPLPPRQPQPEPTEIRIENHIYLVTRLPEGRDLGLRPHPALAQIRARGATMRAKVWHRPGLRAFVIPRSNAPASVEQILIQPDFPVDLKPQTANIPDLEILASMPSVARFRRPFIAPGQGPAGSSVSGLPAESGLAAHSASPSDLSRLKAPEITLPPGPPLFIETPGVPLSQSGDPVDIVALNPLAKPLESRVLVPAGNLLPEGLGQADLETSFDKLSPILEAARGGGMPGGGSAVVLEKPVVIDRSPSGTFDAVIVQSSAAASEGAGLLTGRPIYTVYIAVGARKDWTLSFSVPEPALAPSGSGPVVQLGRVPLVRAPWPSHLVVPPVSWTAQEKYILIQGVVTEAGHFEDLRAVGAIQEHLGEALIECLSQWVFRPAQRDDRAVAVQAVLKIPGGG